MAPVCGLSPRVRGNPTHCTNWPMSARSIPARAGEPGHLRRRWLPVPVYPRACGGTFVRDFVTSGIEGLSPRVRGNLAPRILECTDDGSIPARAGEPTQHRSGPPDRWVYPRACGGTVNGTFGNIIGLGLSPRVRGNPRVGLVQRGYAGSIPARAGEPATGLPAPTKWWVYPRACGGTATCPHLLARTAGLSPRVRGNRIQPPQHFVYIRSIPARAGEP